MSTKKFEVDKAMEMSLDDYIKESNLYVSPVLKQPPLNSTNEVSFKSAGRRIYNADEEDEDNNDIDMQIKEEDKFDLRDKIKGSNETCFVKTPKASSQQWRLMAPNTTQNRPAGMPPLVSTDAESPFNTYTINKRPNHNLKNYVNNNYNCNGNNYNNRDNNRRNYNNKYNNNGGGRNNSKNFQQNRNNNNNGRVQRNNRNMTMNSENMRLAFQNLQSGNPMLKSTNYCNPNGNMSVRASFNTPSEGYNSLPSLLTMQTESILTPKQPPMILEPSQPGQNNNLLALSDNWKEMLPMLAAQFLQSIKANTHEPKYDMKVQKEIHNLQNKPMLYKCPGGEVVSSDGSGINNCQVTVSSTGISMNNRFA